MEKKKKRAKKILGVLKRAYPRARMALRYSNHWELLVAVILSAQCTDKKVNEVTARLFKKYRVLNDYVRAYFREFEKDIYQTGFFRSKTKNILGAARMMRRKYGGKIPKTMEEMLEIPILGMIPEDDDVRKSISIKKAVVHSHPKGNAARAYKEIASKLVNVSYDSDKDKDKFDKWIDEQKAKLNVKIDYSALK